LSGLCEPDFRKVAGDGTRRAAQWISLGSGSPPSDAWRGLMAPLGGLLPTLYNILWAGAGLISLALGALYFFQDSLLYYPSIPGVPKSPRENPQGYRFVFWREGVGDER
jgi:hypothetical protein